MIGLNYRKRVSSMAAYWDTNGTTTQTRIQSDIDYAVSIGADCIDYTAARWVIQPIQAGAFNLFTFAVQYGNSRGIKVVVRMPEYRYGTAGTGINQWDEFTQNTTEQNTFMSDFIWILQQGVNGIEVEESEGSETTDQDLINRRITFKNGFLLRQKNAVQQYRGLDPNFSWGLNWGNSWLGSLRPLGYDLNTIISQKLIQYIIAQMQQPKWKCVNGTCVQTEDGGYGTYASCLSVCTNTSPNPPAGDWGKRRMDELKTRLEGTGIDFGFYMAVFSSRWNYVCEGTTTRVPDCYHQELYNDMRYAQSIGATIALFTLDRLITTPSSRWSYDTTPGATAGDKVRYIWASSSACPSPSFNYSIKVI